jgi:hypothetical protein
MERGASAVSMQGMTDEIHVVPLASGSWSVCSGPHGPALSTHREATEAARRAVACAREQDAARVILHDRYGRTRTTLARPRR